MQPADALRIEISHVADERETLRGTTIRTLDASIDLLSDALHALNNNHAEITAEYLDRVIRNLTTHRNAIR